MAVGLILLLVVETYRVTVRTYHKRQAKKYAYTNLAHDALHRPIDERGKKLTRNEARALSTYQRQEQERRREQEVAFTQGNTLPAYGQIDELERKQSQSWAASAAAAAAAAAAAIGSTSARADQRTAASTSSSSPSSASSSPLASQPNGQTHSDAALDHAESDHRTFSWSAAPPYSLPEEEGQSRHHGLVLRAS